MTGEIIDGRYQLESLIATGGMASIYKAIDLRLDRPVAVKIMHPHLANDEEFVQRFIREAKATAAITHPNVVAIQDQGWNTGGTPAVFIVMEFIDGFTLHDLLVEQGPLSAEDLLKYMTPVVSALSEAHRLGITHRDLKPENILISKDGRIKIADFGLARGAQLGATMTIESSIILGSVSYLSPEQVQRGVSDSRSDIYALGIVFFELLTGRKPHEGQSPIAIAYKHVNEKIPAPSTLVAGIPAELDALVLKATAHNPDQRFANASELLEVMQKIAATLDPSKKQLGLELDLPVRPANDLSARPKRRERPEVRIGNAVLNNQANQANQTNQTQKIKVEDPAMSKTAEVRRKSSQRVRRNRSIAALILLALIAAGWYEISGPGAGISIPSVAGLSTQDARSTLAAIGLKTTIGSKSFDPTIPAGEVISSNPGGGGHLKKGGTVSLDISEGPQPIAAPTPAATPTPSASATANGGATNQITIPSYVGMSGDQAQNELTAAGFVVNSIFGFSESVPAGNVISQSPDAPTTAPAGTKITIVVSQGSAQVVIPNITSLTQSAATIALENLQLRVVVKKIGKGVHVAKVSPAIGSSVARDSTVTITLK